MPNESSTSSVKTSFDDGLNFVITALDKISFEPSINLPSSPEVINLNSNPFVVCSICALDKVR